MPHLQYLNPHRRVVSARSCSCSPLLPYLCQGVLLAQRRWICMLCLQAVLVVPPPWLSCPDSLGPHILLSTSSDGAESHGGEAPAWHILTNGLCIMLSAVVDAQAYTLCSSCFGFCDACNRNVSPLATASAHRSAAAGGAGRGQHLLPPLGRALHGVWAAGSEDWHTARRVLPTGKQNYAYRVL